MGKLNGVPFDLPCIPVYVSISVVSGSGSTVIKIITCVPIPVVVRDSIQIIIILTFKPI